MSDRLIKEDIAISKLINKKINGCKSEIRALQRTCDHPKGFTKKILDNSIHNIAVICEYCYLKKRG